MNLYVTTLRKLGWAALLSVFILTTGYRLGEDRPDWCPDDFATSSCQQTTPTFP